MSGSSSPNAMLRGDRVVEEVVLLEDEPDLPPQVAVVERLHVDAVVEDRPLRRLEQADQALDERRLPGSAAAHDRHGLAGRGFERDPLQDLRRLRAPVLEAHVLEANRPSSVCTDFRRERSAPCSGSCSKTSFSRFRRTALCWTLSQSVRRVDDRGVGERDERVEGHEAADREGPVHHLVRPDPEEEHRGQEASPSGSRPGSSSW